MDLSNIKNWVFDLDTPGVETRTSGERLSARALFKPGGKGDFRRKHGSGIFSGHVLVLGFLAPG